MSDVFNDCTAKLILHRCAQAHVPHIKDKVVSDMSSCPPNKLQQISHSEEQYLYRLGNCNVAVQTCIIDYWKIILLAMQLWKFSCD